MCHLRDIEKIGNQLAHHLPGIVAVVVGEGQLLIVIEQLLPHIPLHLRPHHMSLASDIIPAQCLNNVCYKKHDGKKRKGVHDLIPGSLEQRPRQIPERLWKSEVDQADDHRTEQVKIKHATVRLIVRDKFAKVPHIRFLPRLFLSVTLRRAPRRRRFVHRPVLVIRPAS